MSQQKSPSDLLREFYMVIPADEKVSGISGAFISDEQTAIAFASEQNQKLGIAFAVYKRTGYAPPDLQPACRCKGNPIRQMFCPFGHMTECHAGLTCSEAECGHLNSYGKEPSE